MRTSRRQFLKASAAAALLPMPAIAQGAGPNVVVIGGGPGGSGAPGGQGSRGSGGTHVGKPAVIDVQPT